MYKCKLCNIELEKKRQLAAHMTHKHPKSETQACKICGKVFKYGGLPGHMTTMHPKPGKKVPNRFSKENNPWNNMTYEEHVARTEANRSSKFAHLDNITITDFQKQLILGSLLGDMNIWKQRQGVRCRMARPELRISHSIKQKEYVLWKYNILKDIARREPYEILQKTGFGAGLYACRFETRSLNCLEPIYKIVIGNDGKKHITQEWLDQIVDPIALATWYMDDGGYGGVWIAMGLTSKYESDIVIEWLNKKWNVESIVVYSPSDYNENLYTILRVNTFKSRQRFRELIHPYVIPTMQYKLGGTNKS